MLDEIRRDLRTAENYFANEDQIAEHYLRNVFVKLLLILDALNLQQTRIDVFTLLVKAEKDKAGLLKSDMDEDELYLVWGNEVRRYLLALEVAYGSNSKESQSIHKLKEIVRGSIYSICDEDVHTQVPANEQDVHLRIESILKCIYPDVKTKPTISKSIKNFIPDSGIPSINTLIEYKFVNTKKDAKRIADEILADASGYKSAQWKHLLYVIYETKRLLSETEWANLLDECELRAGFDVVVLSGHAVG